MSINSGPTRAWPKTNPGIDAVLSGRLFVAGGKVTVTDGTAVFQVANPSGSGKLITLQQFFATADSGRDVQFSKNATVNAPSLVTPFNLNLGSSAVSVVVFRTGITGITGGSDIPVTSRLIANQRQEYEALAAIPPGSSVELRIIAPALTTVVCYSTAVWTESRL